MSNIHTERYLPNNRNNPYMSVNSENTDDSIYNFHLETSSVDNKKTQSREIKSQISNSRLWNGRNYICNRIGESTAAKISRKYPSNKYRLVLDTPFLSRSTISYGLIVYAKDTRRWAIIQRKHSIEFLLLFSGCYRPTYISLLLSYITVNEASVIEKCIKGGPNIFTDVYLNELDLNPDGLEYSLIRMAESRDIILKVLPRLDLSKNELSWTWPKGRVHIASNREVPFDCAKREFAEEVEISLPPPLFISDTYISQNTETITGRNIESRYWIYVIPKEISMPPPKFNPEVVNRIWATTETCYSMVIHNDLFKRIIDIVSTIED
jgi:hypothetical protein